MAAIQMARPAKDNKFEIVTSHRIFVFRTDSEGDDDKDGMMKIVVMTMKMVMMMRMVVMMMKTVTMKMVVVMMMMLVRMKMNMMMTTMVMMMMMKMVVGVAV